MATASDPSDDPGSSPSSPLSPASPPLARPLPPPTWRDRVETLADATGVTPVRLVLGAAAVAVGLGVAMWLLRPPSAPAEVELPFASTTTSTATTAPGETPTEVVVHVAGAVAAPGVHRLEPGARVIDAVEAAGGLAADADLARVNLAAELADGSQVYVLREGEEDPPAPVGTDGTASGDGRGPDGVPGGLVDLNRASQTELEALPGIGPATATAVLAHRDEIGRFTHVDQLLDVRGIGPAKLEQLRPLVTV